MKPEELERFQQLLASYVQAMCLQGLRERTIETYSQSLWQVSKHSQRCPDDLSAEEPRNHLAAILESYSWSSTNILASSLVFLHRHVLDRHSDWGKIIKPQTSRSLPDSPTRAEVHSLINSVRKLRVRLFLLADHSLHLQNTKGLKPEAGDIDGSEHRVHIRNGTGGKDRYVVLPEMTMQGVRRLWKSHRHQRLLFPSPVSHQPATNRTGEIMDIGCVQAAFRATLLGRLTFLDSSYR